MYKGDGLKLEYNTELAQKLYMDYIEWIKNTGIDDNLDNYVYYIYNVQKLFIAEKIYWCLKIWDFSLIDTSFRAM